MSDNPHVYGDGESYSALVNCPPALRCRALLLAEDCHVQDCVFDIANPRIARTLRSSGSDAGSGIGEADMNMLSNWNSGQLPHVGSTLSIPKKRTDAKSAKPDGKVKRAKLSGGGED